MKSTRRNANLERKLSIVIQGPIINSGPCTTFRVVESARSNYPNAELILSTWSGSGIDPDWPVDCVVESDDPGGFKVTESLTCNVNRMLLSTQRGLQRAKGQYVMKLRTDLPLTNHNAAELYSRVEAGWKFNKAFGMFSHPVLIPERFTRNPRRYATLYHPSDVFMFGTHKDLSLYWDRPLFEELNHTAEQMLFVSALQRVGFDVSYQEALGRSMRGLARSESFLVSNFELCPWEELGLSMQSHLYKKSGHLCYTPREWSGIRNRVERNGSTSRVWFASWLTMVVMQKVNLLRFFVSKALRPDAKPKK